MLTESMLTALATLATTVLQLRLAQFNALPDAEKTAQAVNERALAQPWIDFALKWATALDKLFKPS